MPAAAQALLCLQVKGARGWQLGRSCGHPDDHCTRKQRDTQPREGVGHMPLGRVRMSGFLLAMEGVRLEVRCTCIRGPRPDQVFLTVTGGPL